MQIAVSYTHLVIFEVVDFRVLSVSKKQYLGVYVGNGEFYLPGYSDSAFDTLCSKLDGIERTNGLIKITQDGNTRPLDKNANYGFLWLCHRNISVKNVYEADIALLNDPKYSAQAVSYTHLANVSTHSISSSLITSFPYIRKVSMSL